MGKRLEIVYIHKDKLRKLPNNPRQEYDPDAVEKLKKLIKGHGFQNPLQVYKERGQYTILCGNHRFDAALELGYEEFPCIIYKGTKKKAIARCLSDNKSNQWTEWDIPGLKDIFADLDDGEFDMDLTGFDEDEIMGFFDNTPDEEPDDNESEDKFKVIIECETEEEQEKVYDFCLKKNYNCKKS